MAESTPELELELLDLQKSLNRRPDTQQTELSHDSSKMSSPSGQRSTNLQRTPNFRNLAARILRDSEKQQMRLKSTTDRATKLQGTEVPAFVLNRINWERSIRVLSKGKLLSALLNYQGQTSVRALWSDRLSGLSLSISEKRQLGSCWCLCQPGFQFSRQSFPRASDPHQAGRVHE